MNWPIILPLIIPLLGACLALAGLNSPRHQLRVGIGATALLLINSLVLVWTASKGVVIVSYIGNWQPPFGIVLMYDRFGAAMLFMSSLVAFCVALYAGASMDHRRVSFGFYPLLLLLLLGINGSFLTGDIFNLFVWFEVMLISSFVLLVLGGEKAQLEGAVKYVTLNLLSSALFVTVLGVLYGLTGTLNMADMGVRLTEASNPTLATALAMILLVTFGMKAAVFPLFFWLPPAYHTPPIAITTIFAGLLTKVGVFALVRAYTLIFTQEPEIYQPILLWVAALTMLAGGLGALAQQDVRRRLSFHIISTIGYMIMGLAIFTEASLTALVFLMVCDIAIKSALFLTTGVMHRIRGSYDMRILGGLYHSRPWFASMFFLCAMALAGIPPLAGFFAKLGLVRAGLEAGLYPMVAVALVTSIMTLYSMSYIWAQVFWKAAPGLDEEAQERADASVGPLFAWQFPIAILLAFILALGLFAEPAFQYATGAAQQLLDTQAYIVPVLGGGS